MDEALATNQAAQRGLRPGLVGLPHQLSQYRRPIARGYCVKIPCVTSPDATESRLAQPQRLVEHRIENRRKIGGRGVDDFQQFSNGALLVESLP